MIHLLEHCRIAPPPDSVEDKSIPLTFFDMPWLYFPSMKILFFYEFSHPKAYFVDTIIPRLKHSLSLTLKHFFPLSGNLIFLTDGSMPEIRYKDGDSVSLTFSECISDLYFNHLSGYHQRTDNDFHPFTASTNSTPFVVPILSIRVTLFPNSAGICIGLTHHHVASDANTFLWFVRSWASINKLGGDATITENPSILSFYDRSFVKDPIWIRSKFWSHFGEIKSEAFQPPPLRTNTLLATFIVGRAEVQRLKKLVIPQIPKKSHVSAFTVVCGYVRSCMVKARARNGEEIFENGSEHLVFSADCWTLLDPPIPTTYFGNCIICFIVTIKSRELIQEDGFIVAAKLIGEAIQESSKEQGRNSEKCREMGRGFEVIEPIANGCGFRISKV